MAMGMAMGTATATAMAMEPSKNQGMAITKMAALLKNGGPGNRNLVFITAQSFC